MFQGIPAIVPDCLSRVGRYDRPKECPEVPSLASCLDTQAIMPLGHVAGLGGELSAVIDSS